MIDLTVSAFHPPHAPLGPDRLPRRRRRWQRHRDGLYSEPGLGPGARDGLTTGIASPGHSIRVVRTSIEAIVLLTGFLLGGTVGVGTVVVRARDRPDHRTHNPRSGDRRAVPKAPARRRTRPATRGRVPRLPRMRSRVRDHGRGRSPAGLALTAAGLWLAMTSAALARPIHALVVLPPGEGSTITLRAYAANQASGSCSGPGRARLRSAADVRELAVSRRRAESDSWDVPGPRCESPAPGVTIVRDSFGVPHVFASGPDEQMIEQRIAYGIGYAQAEERLFQMEVLRRAAEGGAGGAAGAVVSEDGHVTRRDSETAPSARPDRGAQPVEPGCTRQLRAGINAVIRRDTDEQSSMPAGFQLLQDLRSGRGPRRHRRDRLARSPTSRSRRATAKGYGSLVTGWRRGRGLRAVSILNDLQFTHDRHAPVTVPSHQGARLLDRRRRYDFISYTRVDTARLIRPFRPTCTRPTRGC